MPYREYINIPVIENEYYVIFASQYPHFHKEIHYHMNFPKLSKEGLKRLKADATYLSYCAENAGLKARTVFFKEDEDFAERLTKALGWVKLEEFQYLGRTFIKYGKES